MWAITYKGKIINEGWGTDHSWIFRTKWLAQEAIKEEGNDDGFLKIIKIEIKILK